MPQPFHFAFFVKELVAARHTYGDVPGCGGKVDGIAVPIPQCGVIVEWDFILEPRGMAREFRSFRHPEHLFTPA